MVAETLKLKPIRTPNMSLLKASLVSVVALVVATQNAAAQGGKTLPAKGGVVEATAGANGSTLGPFSSLNADCSLKATATVKVLQAPSNGRLRVYQGRGEPAFAADSGFTQCNGRRVPGAMVGYTPQRGYSGEDSFKLEIVFVNGERRPLAVRLDNRAAQRAKR
jgi:hypothetical protein